MVIINDICYANEQSEDIRIREAKPLIGGMILVTFETGEKRLFDTTLLTGSAFEPLKDDAIWRDIQIFHGFMTWNHGEIDIAPETVYYDSYPYEETWHTFSEISKRSFHR